MSLNATPSSERTHIAFFGCTNAGKSSLVNTILNQEFAVVSEKKGTTTDPVLKSMELLPIGAVVIIDTPGFDDESELGEKRITKTKQILNKTDIAVLVVDSTVGLKQTDETLINLFKEKEIPYIVAMNKSDCLPPPVSSADGKNSEQNSRSALEQNSNQFAPTGEHTISVSAKTKHNIEELKNLIGSLAKNHENRNTLFEDDVKEGDTVILVIPIDEAAPRGRLILPEQMALRELLDKKAFAYVTQPAQLPDVLANLKSPPKMIVTDSQAFGEIKDIVPKEIPLTSFSILMARYKGFLDTALKAVAEIENLNDGDTVLISEGCTHHRQCNDIGTVKIPRWLKEYTGKKLNIKTSSGTEFPDDLSGIKLVIHCGGCMITEREVLYRMKCAIDQNVPFTNYGVLIAKMKGIL